MTREEAKNWLNKLYARADITDEYGDAEDVQPYEEAINMAINSLEQEPCEDVIGRLDMLDAIGHGTTYTSEDLQKIIKGLPPVNPQITDQWQELKETITEMRDNDGTGTQQEVCKFLVNLMDVLEKQMQKSKWISVSKRFPKEHLCNDGYIEPSDYVLVWGDHGNYGVSRYWGNRRSKSENPNTHKDWVDLDWVVQKPIAWMPLPTPYEPQERSEEV